MRNIVKDVVKKQLHNICYAKYCKELEIQKDDYAQWIKENEEWKKHKSISLKTNGKHGKNETVVINSMSEFTNGYALPEEQIVVFVREGGLSDESTIDVTGAFFTSNPFVKMAYADEDCVDQNGRRHTPWFKPQWSPDTLQSFAYYGNLLAIRTSFLQEIMKTWEDTEIVKKYFEEGKLPCDTCYMGYEKGEKNLYYAVLLAKQLIGIIPANERQKPIANIDKVLYHKEAEKNVILSDENAAFSDSIHEEGRYPDLTWKDLLSEQEILQSNQKMVAADSGKNSGANDKLKKHLISIIIPSKDQPEVLATCVESVMKYTKQSEELQIQIIIADNGSNARNRLKIEELSRRNKALYLYQPMPFNFSTMCNLGVSKAKGDFLLFLNDDMEILSEDWLEKLLLSASLPHVGAVGAKLLYPDSDLIQHDGITNLTIGPAHKLLKLHDKYVYYHGQNRHNYDMIGVTAACLLIETKKFKEIGGFTEELAVAYNDVDLCFSLYDAGYYNVLRNDVILYHHESLSRGDDLLSDEKKERLLLERKVLFDRHPHLEGYDPFYSEHLAGTKHMYLCDYQYPYEREDYYVEAVLMETPEPVEWENNCLYIEIDKAQLQDKHYYDEEPCAYHIEGWSYVLNMDNSHYKRELLLVHEDGACYKVPIETRMRKDVAKVLQGQQNVELTGFVCRVLRNSIIPGRYHIAMLVKDGCSKQYLYKKTDVILESE